MTYTLTPKMGDKVRVRLRNGRAVDAEYCFKGISNKEHFVIYKDDYYCCCRRLRFHSTESYGARLIYPLSLMPKPEVRE